jgi:hypothetical protein
MGELKPIEFYFDLMSFGLGIGLNFDREWPVFLNIEFGPFTISIQKLRYWRNNE